MAQGSREHDGITHPGLTRCVSPRKNQTEYCLWQIGVQGSVGVGVKDSSPLEPECGGKKEGKEKEYRRRGQLKNTPE